MKTSFSETNLPNEPPSELLVDYCFTCLIVASVAAGKPGDSFAARTGGIHVWRWAPFSDALGAVS